MRGTLAYRAVIGLLRSYNRADCTLGKVQTEAFPFFMSSCDCSRFHNCATSSKVNEVDEKLSFRNLLYKRVQQAHRSVVVQIPSQKAVLEASGFIIELCDTKEILHFTSKSGKDFIIAEFRDSDAAHSFLARCKSVAQAGEVPTFSRTLKYDGGNFIDSSKGTFSANGSRGRVETFQEFEGDKVFKNVAEVMKNTYEDEKLSDIEMKMRFFMCSQISDAFRGLFKHCEVLPFGSSVNGLGTHNSDLDSVLVFYAKKELEDSGLYFQTKEPLDADYEQKILKTVANVLSTFTAGVVHVDPLFKARVPVVKFHHELFELDCDLSTNNVSGLDMSELLYYCGEMDSRVRPLAFAIRKWAKMSKIIIDIGTHAITNFSLFLMLVFFLQKRPLPVLPPLCQLVEVKSNEEKCMALINNLKSKTSNEETLGDLLREFLHFLKDFDFRSNGISTYYGKVVRKQENSPLVIENPLDRRLNVSLNVSKNSLRDLRQTATSSLNYLNVLSRNTEISSSNFWTTVSAQHYTESS